MKRVLYLFVVLMLVLCVSISAMAETVDEGMAQRRVGHGGGRKGIAGGDHKSD